MRETSWDPNQFDIIDWGDDEPDPEEVRVVIAFALDRLPLDERTVIEAVYWEAAGSGGGRAIAMERTGYSRATVDRLLRQARAHLAEVLVALAREGLLPGGWR